MPRDGTIIFGALIGKLGVLQVGVRTLDVWCLGAL
jgi:hypothetical protein